MPRSRPRRTLASGAAVAAAVLGACSSLPPGDALAALARAETLVAEQEFAEARELTDSIDDDSYRGEDLERFQLARARAALGAGEPWAAFRAVEDFLDDHPLTARVPEVEDIVFRAGATLIASDWSFWIFASHVDDGVFVLEHFVRRFQKSARAADALHLLGEAEFARGRYAQAKDHFRQITAYHSDSVWFPKATFRYAMAGFLQLQGPAYDLHGLETTRRELESFLAAPQENLEFAATARAALARTREWLARKHVQLADFYRRVASPGGERLHLRLAAAYADTEAGGEAGRRLAALPPEAEAGS